MNKKQQPKEQQVVLGRTKTPKRAWKPRITRGFDIVGFSCFVKTLVYS